MTYSGQVCTNCGDSIKNNTPEFEYLLNNTHSLLLCTKCAIPVNAFFANIEKRGVKCSDIFTAMTISQKYSKCMLCKKPATKNYFRKKSKRYLLICNECNNILEIYLNEIVKSGGKLRNFALYTDKLNNAVTKIIRSSGINV